MKKFTVAAFLLLLSACSHKAVQVPASNNSGPSLSPQKIQQNMIEAGTPGKQHEFLKRLVGTWNAETKFWIEQKGQPEVSKGKAKASLLYGGRFLSMSYKGKAMGHPFEGQSLMGYDNIGKKYFSTWIDSMNTGINRSEGFGDQSGNVITLNANFVCPMTRELINAEEVMTIIDKNHFKYEMYQIKDGTKFKGLEINYSRTK